MFSKIIVLCISLLLLPGLSSASIIIGGDTIYTIKKGDTLELIGARTGVYWWQIAKDNNIDTKMRLQPGQELKINTRKIVPVIIDNGIIINIPDRTLYFFKDSKLVRFFPVGMGLLTSKTSSSWKTPIGKFKVIAKKKDPTWYVPPSIQEEMALEGKEIITSVPPGPDNPLGRYAIKTSFPGILIHETIKPASVNQYRSHGCIRVIPDNMEIFFEEVEPDTPGELLYMPVKASVSNKGRVFLEVHKDFYSRIGNMKAEAKTQLEKTGIANKVDWQKVEKILKERTGIAEDVTL
ncbi:MAG: L,D-transpeptidase family protein [Nitrospirota bacterium]|nr:L,D-transpeptidase family protein [Nitrospirota bacterium]